MAASRIDGIGVDLTYKGFEVDAKSPRSSWSLGCDITITDADTSIREIKVNDVALSGEIRTDDISVNLNKDKNNVMDLDVSVAVNGIGHSVPESHIVPYVDILKITELSPETINEKRYASSALSVKNIYDLIVTLNKKVEELAHNGEDGSNDNETPQNGWYFKDEILCTDNNVAIFGQLGVGEVGQGDTGGSGGVGTVNAVSVSGVIYSPTDGIIDLTEPFANIDVDLSDYYKRNEVNTKLSDLILNISQTYVTKDAIAGMQNSIASLDKRILVFEEWFKDDGENNIKTTYNFYSTKQIAAGGAAESGDGGSAGGGTVNAVSVNNIVYSPTDGIIDLSEAFANVEVDLSGYYTKSQVDTKISAIDFTPYLTKSIASETYATKESLASTKSSILDSVEATYATKEVVSSISTRVTELGDEVSTLKKDVSALSQRVAVFENWFKDDGEGNIKTTYNFYSTKQLAAGGVGEEGEANGGGSVNAVSVNNVVYSPTDGIIDLTKAFDAIDVSDQLANYATKSALSTLEGRVDTIASYFSTSEDADSQINKWNEIVAFLDATEGTTLDSILSGFLPLSGGTISGALNVTGTVTADKFYMPKPAGGSYDRFRLRDDGSSSIVFQAAKWDGTGTSGSMAFSGLYGDALTSFSIVSNSTAITGSVSIGGSTSITGSNSVGGSLSVTGSTKLSSYLFLGSNAEGIYLDGTTLSWHDATNTYVNSLLRFAQDSVSVSRAMYLDKTLSLVERLYANGGAYIKGKVNFGADADGILIQDNYIAWHTSSNTEANRLIDFAATSIAITPAVTLNNTLAVTGATALSSTLSVTGASTFTGNTTNKGIAYFAGGTTYYVNASGAAKFASLTSVGAISGTNGSFSGTLAVTGASTFTGKTTHNGGIGATTGAFSSTLSVSGATTLKSTLGVTGAATLSSTLSVAGLLTASAGIKVAAGQSITFLDSSGKSHTLSYDSTNEAFKFNGNMFTTGQLAAGEVGEAGGTGAGGGNAVSFTPTLTSGVEIGSIKIDGVSTTLYAPTYTLPVATSDNFGVVKIGYTQNSRNYPIELNSDGQMFVNVPWSNTHFTTGICVGKSQTIENDAAGNPYIKILDNTILSSQIQLVGEGGTTITSSGGIIFIKSANTTANWNEITGKPSFATVATSGSYTDLSDKPTIPTVPTSLKSPYALTINGTSYDGSAAKTVSITASSLGALTSHQTIYALTIKNSAGTAQLTYTPNSAAGSLTLSKAMVGLGSVANTADGDKVVKAVLDYNDKTVPIYVGFAGASLTAANTDFLAAYGQDSAGNRVIKDIPKAQVRIWLGLGDLAYLSSLSKSDVGLGNVENKSSATIRGEITSANVTTALGYTPFSTLNFTKSNIKTALGISDWALSSSKPSYAYSEITSKPTTVSGYGITDAVTLTGSQALTNKTYNGYTLGAACAKGVTTVIGQSGDLPTSLAVYDALSAGGGRVYGAANISQITAIENGSVILYTALTVFSMKNVKPIREDRACVVYLIKVNSAVLSIAVRETSGIQIISSTGAAATAATSIANYNSLMLVWNTQGGFWIGYIISA